jgi:uncharacterized protein YukE
MAKTLVNLDAVQATVQKAQNLLAEAQALGAQYLSHSQDIAGVGWTGDANQTSLMVSEHVNSDLVKMVNATNDLVDQLNKFAQSAAHQDAAARTALQGVHPGGS